MARVARIALVLAGLLLAALLAASLAALAVSRGWQRERLREAAEAALERALAEPVALAALEGPLVPRISLAGIRVGPADGAPFATISRVSIEIDPCASLAARAIVIRKLAIAGVEAVIARDAAGDWQLPAFLRAGAPDAAGGAAAPLEVLRTAISDVTLRAAWQEAGEPFAVVATGSAELDAVSLPMRADAGLHGRASVEVRGEDGARRFFDTARLSAELDGRRIRLDTLEVTGGGRPPLSLARPAAIALDDGGMRFESLELRSRDQALTLDGGVAPDRFRALAVEVRELDVTLAARLLGLPLEPGGVVTGTARLDGAFSTPSGAVELRWREPRIAGWRGRLVSLAAALDAGAVRLDALAIEEADGTAMRLARPAQVRISADAVVVTGLELAGAGRELAVAGGVAADGFRDLRVTLRDVDLALAARLAGIAAEPGGRATGEVRLDGPFLRPTARADLTWREARVADWRADAIRLDGEADARAIRAQVRVEHAASEALRLDLALDTAALERWWRRRPDAALLPPGLRATLRSSGIPLALLAPLLPDAIAGGTLAGELEIRGDAPVSVAGTLLLEDGVLVLPGREPIEPIRATLSLRPDPNGIGIEALRLDAPALELRAAGTVAPEGPAPLEVSLSVPDLAAAAEAYRLAAPLVGELEAAASLRGGWRRPAIGGSARWTHPAPGVTRPHRVELDFASGGDALTGDVTVHQRDRVAARGKLLLPYGDGGLAALAANPLAGARVELHADGFELATLSPLLSRRVRDLRGRADAQVSAQADGAGGVELAGSLRVTGGSFHVPLARQTFEPIEASVSFRNDAVVIERVRVGEPGAHADVSGSITLDAELRPEQVALDLEATRLPIARARALTTDVSGRATLRGPPEALRLDGELALSDTRVRLVERGDPALREIEVVTSDTRRASASELVETARPPDAWERATVDLTLTVPRNSWVRGRGANIDLAGALRLEKEPLGAARVSGTVVAQRGTYRFQGKRFELRRGEVSFEGGAELDPLLDIEATHRVRDVTIVIELSGRASAPVVRLSSEPDLPEEDVLAMLFFGRRSRELGAEQPAADLDRAATALAAGVALREASALVEDALPLDSIDVRMEEDGSATDVGLGKYLTDDLFVRYERSFGSDASDGVEVELRLSDHWRLETEASTDESAGMDLIWHYDY